jgi:hypothetical protein
MTDLEDRLRTDAAAWQRLVDGGARGIELGKNRAPRRSWFAPALSAAAVLAVAVALASVFNGGSNRPAPNGGQPWRTHTFGALTLRFPSNWSVLNPRTDELGPVSHSGYLVSRRDIVQCPTGPRPVCDNPVPRLTGDASVITSAVIGIGSAASLKASTTIDGWPAFFRSHIRGCPQGARYGAKVQFRAAFGWVELYGCTASSNPAERHIIERILKTMRYSDPNAVTISGQLVVSGMSIHGPRPGRVSLTNIHGGKISVPVDRTGRYSVRIAAGRYVITGRALGFRIGCSGGTVDATQSVTADVVCALK